VTATPHTEERTASDTPAGQACTQRRYDYDRDSNRTGQVTGASCATGTGGTTTSHSYDEADRLTDTGTSYDKLGNTTALAAANAGGYAITSPPQLRRAGFDGNRQRTRKRM